MGLFSKKQLESSAEVVDKHLILSLPNATEPVVWRMSLDKIGTASFEVKQVKTSDVYKLTLKPKKGAAETIASFADKEQTLRALLHASNAMQRQEHDSVSLQNNTAAPSKSSKEHKKWLYLLFGFFAVIALYVYMAKQIPNTINNFGSEDATTTQSSEEKTGVPLSADDFLNGL